LNYATDTLRLLVAYVADYLDLNKKSTTNSYTGVYLTASTASGCKRRRKRNMKEKYNNRLSNITGKIQGASPQVPFTARNINRKFPWICSLRRSGYRGYHICGVTMLSAPKEDDPNSPTILVSAAHCNYVCKDSNGRILESCCCNKNGKAGLVINCRLSIHCGNGNDPQIVKAEPEDLVIVCGEASVEIENQYNSEENEISMQVLDYHNHPKYNPKDILNGFDISVYRVNDQYLRNFTQNQLNPRNIWPICLPKSDQAYATGSSTQREARIAGWDSPDVNTRNIGGLNTKSFVEYERSTFFQKEALMDEVIDCQEPADQYDDLTPSERASYIKPYYPPKGKCFRDRTMMSCPNFGISGSGLMRPILTNTRGDIRYSFFGPLSFHRGCQVNLIQREQTASDAALFIRQAINPTFFTEAICYMPWIAAKYNMRMPSNFDYPQSCTSDGIGNRIYQRPASECKAYTSRGWEKCEFNFGDDFFGVGNNCWSFDQEGHTDHSFYCYTYRDPASSEPDRIGTCRSNCPGVREKQIGIGAFAVISAASIAGSFFAPPLTVASTVLLGSAVMSRQRRCPDQCKTSFGQCSRICQRRLRAAQLAANNATRRVFTQGIAKQVLTDLNGKSENEQLRIIQAALSSNSIADSCTRRSLDDQDKGILDHGLNLINDIISGAFNFLNR